MIGYISVAENDNLPFNVERIYWTYYTPESINRGGHAHYELEQILVAVSGKIIVHTEMPGGQKERFILETPNIGIFYPNIAGTKCITPTILYKCVLPTLFTTSLTI